MKKPERVEVGQWWAWCNQRGPKRIETIRMYSGRLEAEYGNGHGSVVCQWLIENGEYLGSGDHPEPSEWMIETLAEHLMTCGGSSKSAEPMLFDDVRLHVMAVLNGITSPFVGMESERDATRNVLSLYRILRSLGKW
jgi:hypothetical protein